MSRTIKYYCYKDIIFTADDIAETTGKTKESVYQYLRDYSIKSFAEKFLNGKQIKRKVTHQSCKAKDWKECFNCPYSDCIRGHFLKGEPNADRFTKMKDGKRGRTASGNYDFSGRDIESATESTNCEN